MNSHKTFYISPLGGSISCLNGLNGRIFRSCVANRCTYSRNLHSAKSNLKKLEHRNKFLPQTIQSNIPPQRKTTLKWNPDGSLSSIDMTRILSRLGINKLTECELTCESNIN